jgi:hypothetical protein
MRREAAHWRSQRKRELQDSDAEDEVRSVRYAEPEELPAEPATKPAL